MNRKKRTMKKFMMGYLLLIATAWQLHAQGLNGTELRVYDYDADGNRIERRQEFSGSTQFLYNLKVGEETVTMKLDTETQEALFTRIRPTGQNGKMIFYKGEKIVKILALGKEPVTLSLNSYKSGELRMEITIGDDTYTETLTW